MRFIPLLLLALLVGCSSQPVKEEEKPDYLSLQKEADSLYGEGKYAQALELYKQITTDVPREATPWFRLGNIYVQLGQPELAVAAYQEALLREPDMLKGWNNLGIVRMRQAVNAYTQLCGNSSKEHPLCVNSRRIINGINDLLAPPAPEQKHAEPLSAPDADDTGKSPSAESTNSDEKPITEAPKTEQLIIPNTLMLRGTAWLAEQDPDTLFLQIGSGYFREPLQQTAKQYQLYGRQFHLYQATNSEGKIFFQLLAGPFSNSKELMQFIGTLSPDIRELEPIVRKTASLQALRNLNAETP